MSGYSANFPSVPEDASEYPEPVLKNYSFDSSVKVSFRVFSCICFFQFQLCILKSHLSKLLLSYADHLNDIIAEITVACDFEYPALAIGQ